MNRQNSSHAAEERQSVFELDTEQKAAIPSMTASEPPLQRTSPSGFLTTWANIKNQYRSFHSALFSRPAEGNELFSALNTPLLERAGQCCFLCLTKDASEFAVTIPCLKPSQSRIVEEVRPEFDEPFLEKAHHKTNPLEDACESDTKIFQRLRSECFKYHGRWKRWLPFYDIINVEEVQFQFLGLMDDDGTFPIRVTRFDLARVEEQLDQILALEPNRTDINSDDFCHESGDHHSQKCMRMMNHESKPCILTQVAAARTRRRKIRMLFLLTLCAQDPARANGLDCLEGIVTETCIYDMHGTNQVARPVRDQPYNGNDIVRGLHFTVGWRKDRLSRELPRNTLWASIAVLFVWTCISAWSGQGDWRIALQFGSLVAACILLLPFRA